MHKILVIKNAWECGHTGAGSKRGQRACPFCSDGETYKDGIWCCSNCYHDAPSSVSSWSMRLLSWRSKKHFATSLHGSRAGSIKREAKRLRFCKASIFKVKTV